MVLWSLSTFELLQINWSDTDIGGLDSIPYMWVSHSETLESSDNSSGVTHFLTMNTDRK